MLSKDGSVFKSLLIIFLISISSATASGWYQVYEDATQPNIKAAVYGNYDINDIYAVGDTGRYYVLQHFGREWSWEVQTISTENLRTIVTAKDWNNNGVQIQMVAGENGAVLIYDSSLQEWFAHDSLGTETYNVAFYDENTSRFLVGGNHGQFYYSQDYGRHWLNKPFDTSYNILGFASSYDWLFVFAEKNDSTFVLRESMNSGVFYSAPGDTLPDIKFIDSAKPAGGYGDIYILGLETGVPDAHLYEFTTYSQDTPPTEIFSGDLGIVTGIGAWSSGEGYIGGKTSAGFEGMVLWVTVEAGGIWESADVGASWSLIYSDSENRDLFSVLAGNSERLEGRAFGSGGIVLKYGFELHSGFPGPNEIVSSDLQDIKLGFTLIPDLGSVQSGIRILSDQRGDIPFNAEYLEEDSTQIRLILNDLPGGIQIPGEKLNITLGDTLHEKAGPLWQPFHTLNYDITLVSPMVTSFQFSRSFRSQPLGHSVTNWVTGFINEDDNLDMLTFGADTIFCYTGSDTGNVYTLQTIPMAGIAQIDSNMAEQLVLTDVNNDGLPDILLYSSSAVYMLINRSSGQQVQFGLPSAQLSAEGIKKIIVYNNNNNNKVDMLLDGTSLYTLLDIDENSFDSDQITHEYQATPKADIKMADIDGDGRQEMIILNSDLMLEIYKGQDDWNNRTWYDSYSGVSPVDSRSYGGIQISDMDRDHRQEIIAYSSPYETSPYLDLVYLSDDISGEWQFSTMQDFILLGHSPIYDVFIQEFGGQRDEQNSAKPDITVLSQDSILFFENETNYPGEYSVIPLPQYTKATGGAFNGIFAGDYNKDAALDFSVFNMSAGQFDIWYKFMWKPVIENTWIGDNQINLAWTPLPPEAGTLEYYLVARDTTPQFDYNRTYIRQSYQSSFVDYEVGEYDSFWYSVQAIYNNGTESEWSEPVHLQTYFELNGPQAGVLSDTTKPYLAETSISVESGASLEIHPGIRIGFKPGTRFDVWGALQVAGNEIENQMVDLQSTWQDSLSSWDGVYLHPASDTVRFEWFSVAGAKNGITVENRPLQLKFGGIMQNETGLQATGDTLNIQNVIFDSNRVALHVYGGTHAEVKNVMIVHSQFNSIVAEGTSRTRVRNAIIWDNLGPVTKENAVTLLRVSYSTVDSIKQSVGQTEVSHLAPIFMPPDSGDFRIDYMSPTIDAGDPEDDFSEEPAPNGGRINQGLFGGSFMATPSLQPRIKINPQAMLLKIRPLNSDTSSFVIHNPGGSALEVSRIELQSEGSVFQLLNSSAHSISPGDSVLVPVMFTPPQIGDYSDTIRVYCNDPHLEKGFAAALLLGRGSDEAPIVRIDPLPQHIIHESAVRFWYSVADSGSNVDAPAQEGTYVVRYNLLHFVDGDTIVRSGSARTGDHFDFSHLDDGLYVLKMWANPLVGVYIGENHVKRQFFRIDVRTKTAFRLRWYLVSIPRNYSVNWNWFALEDTLAYLLKWDNAEEKYIPLDIENVEPGQAFWTFPFKKMEIDLAKVDSLQTPVKTGDYIPIHALETGWNQIGIPLDYRIFWHQMRFYTEDGGEYDFLQAVQDSLIDGVVYNFKQNEDFQGYDWSVVDSTSRAEPWLGYWLRVNRPCEVQFPDNPAYESRTAAIIIEDAGSVQKSMAVKNEGGWRLNLSLRNKHYADLKNILGIGSGSSIRVMEPPHIGDFCAVYMSSEKGNITQKIYSAFKSNEDVKTWHLQVVSHEANIPHTFSWDNSVLKREDVYLYLVDEQSETVINMNEENNYVFTPGAGKTTFKVYATQNESFKPELIPLTFKLEQNFPNPFNPSTTIRFGIPAEAGGKKVVLTVYDILGKKVAEIYNGRLKSGYHSFVWNGRNIKGAKTASGVYFYRLEAAGKQIVKKMVLVR